MWRPTNIHLLWGYIRKEKSARPNYTKLLREMEKKKKDETEGKFTSLIQNIYAQSQMHEVANQMICWYVKFTEILIETSW